MKILIVLLKNTAPLDFIIPVLNELNHDENTEINILFCDLSKFTFLRKSEFYSDFFREKKINDFDYLSFSSIKCKLIINYLRKLYSRSHYDSESTSKVKLRIERLIYNQIITTINFRNIIDVIGPNVILLGNTDSKNKLGINEIIHSIHDKRIRTILLPHAPHHRTTTIITPFYKEKNWILPEFCEYWMPFIHDQTWKNIPNKKRNFKYIGYPGLDHSWLTLLKENNKIVNNNQQLKILFIIRRFDSKNNQNDNTKDFIYSYSEFINVCNLVNKSLKNLADDYKIIVKPHPSNDYSELNKIIFEQGFNEWELTYEPIYSFIGNTDLIISMYSTIHLVPAIAGIPVILLSSSIQEIAESDDKIKELYHGMQFYLKDNNKLGDTLRGIININRVSPPSPDIKHIRNFFPDLAITRSINRILGKQ
ncbi:MAG: hypothetical protein JEZ06_08720 [Anaerolineaceae bacterium]|nr:hypothetical protein [Anaerolineaceae bacterium]